MRRNAGDRQQNYANEISEALDTDRFQCEGFSGRDPTIAQANPRTHDQELPRQTEKFLFQQAEPDRLKVMTRDTPTSHAVRGSIGPFILNPPGAGESVYNKSSLTEITNGVWDAESH